MTRRDLLWTSAAGLGAQTLRAADTIGTGMIGVGNRGAYLLKNVLAQPNVKVLALCDIKPDRLDKAASAAARDNPATYSDWRRILERKDIDAVYIATPCDLHVEMSIAALEAGKHVYCEKPAGITPESIGRLVKAARAAKTVYQIGQQLRSDQRLHEVIRSIRDGVAGKLIMVKAQRHSGGDLPHDSSSSDWFFNVVRSGDVIVEMAVHNLDLVNWVLDSRPEMAGGFGGNLMWVNDPPGRTNMDGYTLSYEFLSGAKSSFTQVFFHPNGMPGNGQYVYAYGTQGAVDVTNGTMYPMERGAKPVTLVEPQARGVYEQAHVAAFFDAVRGTRKTPAGIDVAATAALTAILGREAIYRKKTMHWRDLGVNL